PGNDTDKAERVRGGLLLAASFLEFSGEVVGAVEDTHDGQLLVREFVEDDVRVDDDAAHAEFEIVTAPAPVGEDGQLAEGFIQSGGEFARGGWAMFVEVGESRADVGFSSVSPVVSTHHPASARRAAFRARPSFRISPTSRGPPRPASISSNPSCIS